MTERRNKRNDIVLPEEFQKKLIELYPDVNKIYPYLHKKSNRVALRLLNNKDHIKGTYLSRASLEVKLGRRLTKNETCDHIDEDKTNDHPDNLQILSRAQNTSKGHAMGHCQAPPLHIGENQWQAILDPDKVREIRRLKSEGSSVGSISRKFGMKPHSIYDVTRRRSWKHVE